MSTRTLLRVILFIGGGFTGYGIAGINRPDQPDDAAYILLLIAGLILLCVSSALIVYGDDRD